MSDKNINLLLTCQYCRLEFIPLFPGFKGLCYSCFSEGYEDKWKREEFMNSSIFLDFFAAESFSVAITAHHSSPLTPGQHSSRLIRAWIVALSNSLIIITFCMELEQVDCKDNLLCLWLIFTVMSTHHTCFDFSSSLVPLNSGLSRHVRDRSPLDMTRSFALWSMMKNGHMDYCKVMSERLGLAMTDAGTLT